MGGGFGGGRLAPLRTPDAVRIEFHDSNPCVEATRWPFTTVMTGPPTNFQPPNGVFLLRDLNRWGSMVSSRPRSRIVTSPGRPTARLPPGRPNSFAGSVVR